MLSSPLPRRLPIGYPVGRWSLGMLVFVALSGCGEGGAPIIDTVPLPAELVASEAGVEVWASITDDTRVVVARLFWGTSTADTPQAILLEKDGQTDRYHARLPALPAPATVRYRLEAVDDAGNVSRAPVATPDDPSPSFSVQFVLPAGER